MNSDSEYKNITFFFILSNQWIDTHMMGLIFTHLACFYRTPFESIIVVLLSFFLFAFVLSCPLIYGFWLPLWHLLTFFLFIIFTINIPKKWIFCKSVLMYFIFNIAVFRCKPNPCYNGGICADLGYSYKCSCKKPYSGKRCQG